MTDLECTGNFTDRDARIGTVTASDQEQQVLLWGDAGQTRLLLGKMKKPSKRAAEVGLVPILHITKCGRG